MKKRRVIAFLCGLITTFILAAGLRWIVSSALEARATTISVSAAASLQEALEEVQPLYRQTKASVKIKHNFGTSGALQQQTEQGSPEDIFVSAAQKEMDALQSKGLILKDTRRKLLTNRLALIVPKNSSGITSFRQLIASKVKKIAIGDPKSLPEGQYAEQVFKNLGILPQVRRKFVLSKDIRKVLAAVESGNADAGVVYTTEAKTSNQVKVVATASQKLHSPIVYSVAVLKNSKNIPVAKEYVKFLSSNKAKPVFEKYGFKMAR